MTKYDVWLLRARVDRFLAAGYDTTSGQWPTALGSGAPGGVDSARACVWRKLLGGSVQLCATSFVQQHRETTSPVLRVT